MFFYKINKINSSNLDTPIINHSLKATIVPLVSPISAIGQYLLSVDSAILSAYSDEVSITYIHENDTKYFEEFAKKIIDIAKNNIGIKPRDNCILIFVSLENKLFILDNIDCDNSKEFRNMMFDIIDALESSTNTDIEEEIEKIQKDRLYLKVYKFIDNHHKKLEPLLSLITGL